MTEAEIFLNSCASRGRMTLPDHLTIAGFTDRTKRRAITLRVNQLLLTEQFKNLVGNVITQDQDARGTKPAWAKDAPTQKNKIERPAGTEVTRSPGFVSAMNLIRNPDSRQELEAVIGRQSHRAARVITNAMETLAREGELDRREKELTAAALDDSRQNAEALRRAISGLTQGLTGKAPALS